MYSDIWNNYKVIGYFVTDNCTSEFFVWNSIKWVNYKKIDINLVT